MKILVFAHKLDVGGSQLNAIELAATIQDCGHEVIVFATPGPMVKVLAEKGIRFIAAPDARYHPAPGRMRALRAAVRRERPDVVHVWDWWQFLDSYFAVHVLMGTPMIVSDMLMDITRILPKRLLTTFGIPELVDGARSEGWRAQLLLPPVDVHLNSPKAVDPKAFREQYNIKTSEITIVTVSRLAENMKSESLFRSVEAVRTLGSDLPIRLIIVGDGAVRPKLEKLAHEVNEELGRSAVTLTGELLDPRMAYAAADIVMGMGGSALRGMAFGKPVIVVGEQGFSAPLTPETAAAFHYKGIYGHGDGSPSNERLVANIRQLAEHPESFAELGKFSRGYVLEHFALEAVSATLLKYYRQVAATKPRLMDTVLDALRTIAVYISERKFMWRWELPASAPLATLDKAALPSDVEVVP